MKKLILLISTIMFGHLCFANSSATNSLKSLNSTWHKQGSINTNQVKEDLEIVYGGEDISRRPALVFHGATA